MSTKTLACSVVRPAAARPPLAQEFGYETADVLVDRTLRVADRR